MYSVGSASKSKQKTQNKAIKNLYNIKKRENTKQINIQYDILPITYMLKIHQSLLIHAMKNNSVLTNTTLQQNSDLHHHNTRKKHDIRQNSTKSTRFGSNSALVGAISTYNNLPTEIRSTENMKIFKLQVKNYFKQKYSNDLK